MNRREALATLGAGALAMGAGTMRAGAENSMPELKAGYANGEFVLPPLPYPYDALEPHIDAQTMKLHHDLHHAGYVKGANAAMAALAEIREGKRPDTETKWWEAELAFNGSGHVLHTLFWTNMAPKPGKPSDDLTKALDAIGGIEKVQAQLTAAAKSVEGSGWGILGYHPMTDGLVVLQAGNHQNLTLQGVVPLLVVDVWEHAYYLKYQNKRPDYIAAWWNVADWGDASRRFEAARS